MIEINESMKHTLLLNPGSIKDLDLVGTIVVVVVGSNGSVDDAITCLGKFGIVSNVVLPNVIRT